MLSIPLSAPRAPIPETSEKSFGLAFLRDHLNRCFIINYGDLGAFGEGKKFSVSFHDQTLPRSRHECRLEEEKEKPFRAQSNHQQQHKVEGEGNAGLTA
jgi:hypothetical protein